MAKVTPRIGSESVEIAENDHSQTPDVEKPKRKWYDFGFPKSIYFIISNEFCERFTYYGMKAILTIYLLNGLDYDESTSVFIYHAFAMLCYFTPILGGMIADVWWGKYLTIVILSFVYAIGNCTTAFTSFDNMPLDLKRIGCFAGLALIGIGTGGIKPCVSSFGADQIPEENVEVRSRFFASFYFAINAGSMISMIITPILRSEVSFPVAFGVPAALMLVAIGVFLLGTPLYIRPKPQGNVLLDVFKCCWRATKNWSRYRKTNPKPFLDHADDMFPSQFIEDVRACKRIVVMMLPVPMFWALFDQTGSTWTLQGQKMDGSLGSIYILPDQFQVINPLLVMIMIPLFTAFIYPAFNKCKLFLPNRLLQRMVAGGILASIAFVIAAIVQAPLEPLSYKPPAAGLSRLHFINLDQTGSFKIQYGDNPSIPSIYQSEKATEIDYPIDKPTLTYIDSENQNYIITNLTRQKRAVTSYVYYKNEILQLRNPDPFADSSGSIRIVWVNVPHMYRDAGISSLQIESSLCSACKWKFDDVSTVFRSVPAPVNADNFFSEIPIGEHSFKVTYNVSGVQNTTEIKRTFKDGIDSVAILALTYENGAFNMTIIRELNPKTISMFLMIPQYIVLTCAEILFSISGLDFAYTQAPNSMRSVMMAVWLLTVAFGNLIVMILAEINLFGPPGMSLFYAALMALDIIIFAIMAYFYVYIDQVDTKQAEASRDYAKVDDNADKRSDMRPPAYSNDAYTRDTGYTVQSGNYQRGIGEETNL